jgi:hypothetical protein
MSPFENYSSEQPRKPKESPEIIKISQEEAEEISKMTPENAIDDALPHAEKDEQRKELVRKAFDSYISSIPENALQQVKDKKIAKAQQIISSPEFLKKVGYALDNIRNLDVDQSATAFANLIRDKIKESRQ